MRASIGHFLTTIYCLRAGPVAALGLPAHLPGVVVCQVGLHRLRARLQRVRLPGAAPPAAQGCMVPRRSKRLHACLSSVPIRWWMHAALGRSCTMLTVTLLLTQ